MVGEDLQVLQTALVLFLVLREVLCERLVLGGKHDGSGMVEGGLIREKIRV